MDEEEAAELFSASGGNGAGPSSRADAPPSLQAAAAIDSGGIAAAAAEFPARLTAAAAGLPPETADDVRGAAAPFRQLAADEQRPAEAGQPAAARFRTAAAATAMAAEAQQDPLVTEALEAAQQQRDNSLAVGMNGNSMSSQHSEPPVVGDRISRQPGDLEAGCTVTAPHESSNGSQPTAQHVAPQPSDGRPRCSNPSSGGNLRQQNIAIDVDGRRRENDSHSSMHTMQLRQPWPTHPGAALDGSRACCVASQHQQQPQGRMWE